MGIEFRLNTEATTNSCDATPVLTERVTDANACKRAAYYIDNTKTIYKYTEVSVDDPALPKGCFADENASPSSGTKLVRFNTHPTGGASHAFSSSSCSVRKRAGGGQPRAAQAAHSESSAAPAHSAPARAK